MINQDLERRIEAYRGNPQALMQRYQQSQQLIDLLALQRIKSEKEAAARQIQMQMGQQPTVAEQREAEVMDLTRQEVAQRVGEVGQQKQQQQQQAMQKMMGGLAAAPGAQSMMPTQAMAAGGIVAFDNGGDVSAIAGEETLTEEERQAYREREEARLAREEVAAQRARMRRRGVPLEDRVAEVAEKLGAAGSDVVGALPRAAKAAFQGQPESYTPAMDVIRRRPVDPSEFMRGPGAGSEVRDLSEAYPTGGPDTQRPTEGIAQLLRQQQSGQSGGAQAGAAGSTPTPAPTLQRTQVPPVPGVDRGQRTGMEGISQVGDPKLREALARMMDPQRAEQERIRAQAAAKAAYDLTPEERARYDRHMAELEQLDKQRFSPEALRRRRWEDFAAGAVNKESMAGALGGGAASAVRGGRTMEEAQREALLQRQKQAEAMLERQRGIRKGVFEASEKAGEEATKGLPAALQTAGSLETAALKSSDEAKNRAAALERLGIERESAEKIAMLQAQSSAMIAQATRENTLSLNHDRLLNRITENERAAIQELRTKNPAYTALLRKQQSGLFMPDDEKKLAALEAGFSREEQAIRADFAKQREALSMAGFRVLKD